MLDLRYATPKGWLDAVFADFDAFLIDHAACERKASATGMSFVVRYPDRKLLIEPMIEFAREELEHFHIVYRLMAQRDLCLAGDYKDIYVNSLLKQCRASTDELLMDRLLTAGIVEARGFERLHMVAVALESKDARLSQIYMDLARAESRHHALFYRFAKLLFPDQAVEQRSAALLDFEADLVKSIPHQARVH